MVGQLSAQIALLVFAVSIIAGLSVGNTPMTILSRALIAMVVAVIVGQFAAWVAKMVMRDFLQQKKLRIDRDHFLAQEEFDVEAATEAEVEAGMAEATGS